MKNKVKKPNIPLRRKIDIIYARIMLGFKIFIVGFIIIFCFTSYFASHKQQYMNFVYDFLRGYGFTVEDIIVEGTKNLTSLEVKKYSGVKIQSSILKINIKQLKTQLEKNSWIKEATVRRELPNMIRITLVEKIPIAIWQTNQKLYLIDKEGDKITNDFNNKTFPSLIHVVGRDANIYANKLVEDFIPVPELSGKLLAAVRCSDRRWDLHFIQNIIVQMPEDNFNYALQYLVKLNNDNKFFDQNHKILDMRDHDKYYIEDHE